jgi:hypothetical protein
VCRAFKDWPYREFRDWLEQLREHKVYKAIKDYRELVSKEVKA